MPKNDNPQSIRLYESIKKNVNKAAAEQMAEKYPLSSAALFDKKYQWAENICSQLEADYDEATVKTIRMDCACGPEFGKIGKLQKLYQSCDGPAEFAEKATKLNQGYTIEYKDNALFLIYPQCYCSCVKRVEKPMSKTWCYCTVGYAKRMFSTVLEKEVDVELIESVKMGNEKCLMKIIF